MMMMMVMMMSEDIDVSCTTTNWETSGSPGRGVPLKCPRGQPRAKSLLSNDVVTSVPTEEKEINHQQR